MKELSFNRLVSLIFLLLIAALFSIGSNPFPYNLYPTFLIISYAIFVEIILQVLPSQGVIRIMGLWFIVLIPPPVWTAQGIILLYPKPPIASYDVLLPMLWILITILLYIYSIAVSLMQIFHSK